MLRQFSLPLLPLEPVQLMYVETARSHVTWRRTMSSVETRRHSWMTAGAAPAPLLLLQLPQSLFPLSCQFAVRDGLEVEVSSGAGVTLAPIVMADKYCGLAPMTLDILQFQFWRWRSGRYWSCGWLWLWVQHLNLGLWRSRTRGGQVNWGPGT